MPSSTGIELGPDSCVLVAARPGEGVCDVSAVHVLGDNEWSGSELSVVRALKAARRTKRMPRPARVVDWISPPGAGLDPQATAALRAVRSAGFRVQAVLTPEQALAALATVTRRPQTGATAWLALNTSGAAIVIVNGSELLYSQRISWMFDPGAIVLRRQLLQRYSLISHIAPVLSHGIAQVRRTHGLAVETVVTCGNVPDLRSLTMPLIEELDLEVGTLDSLEGLRAIGGSAGDRLTDAAPVIRVACGAAMVPIRSAVRPGKWGWAAAAAILVGVAGLVVFASQRSTVRSLNLPAEPADTSAVSQVPSTAEKQEAPRAAIIVPSAPVRAPSVTTELQSAPMPAPAPRAEKPRSELLDEVRRPALPLRKPRLAATPLALALPRISAILVGPDRRIAVIEGQSVRVGQSVGPRIVVAIDDGGVVLKEPSGLEIRVPIRPRGGAPDELQFSPFRERAPEWTGFSARLR